MICIPELKEGDTVIARPDALTVQRDSTMLLILTYEYAREMPGIEIGILPNMNMSTAVLVRVPCQHDLDKEVRRIRLINLASSIVACYGLAMNRLFPKEPPTGTHHFCVVNPEVETVYGQGSNNAND